MKLPTNLYVTYSIASVFFCFLSSQQLVAQENTDYRYSFELITDNDAYVAWQNSDQYYSFGVGMKMAFRPKRFLGLQGLLPNRQNFFIDIQLKSEGYTSSNKTVLPLEVEQDSVYFDHPFAGVLYGQLGANYTFTRSFVKARLLLGVIGPSAFARQLQDWIHENITEDGVLEGWEFQIPDQIIFNLDLIGTYDFMPETKGFDVYAKGHLRAGNLVIDARPLVGIRLGKFGPLTTSSPFGNGVLATKPISEFYLRSTVSAAFTLFNATAQGNLFDRDFEYAIKDFNQFHTAMSHGIFFRINRYSLGFDHIFTFGKSIKGVRHIYGRIHLEYTF
jgi:hypothetical protein